MSVRLVVGLVLAVVCELAVQSRRRVTRSARVWWQRQLAADPARWDEARRPW